MLTSPGHTSSKLRTKQEEKEKEQKKKITIIIINALNSI
jgi:hypothetical protein